MDQDRDMISTGDPAAGSGLSVEVITPDAERFIAGVQALLFAAHEPLPASVLFAVNGQTGWPLDRVVEEINRRFETGSHPMRVRTVAGGYQMHILPDFAPIVEAHLVKTKTQRLSRAGLETLAIIAYRQPCTTPEIERVRGVACDGVLRTLLERNLVTIKGRSDAPGRPLLYVTTREFLSYFGLNSLDELPGEEELEQLMTDRAREGGDPLPAMPVVAQTTRDMSNLFGTIVLKRGPETASGDDPDAFQIRDVTGTTGDTGWNAAESDSHSDRMPASSPGADDVSESDIEDSVAGHEAAEQGEVESADQVAETASSQLN